MRLVAISDDDLRDSFGIGVAGNFAGHLEQAGEDRDFVAVAASPAAPKGIFPFYARAATNYLADYPISSTRIAWTTVGDLQIEPELAVICSIDYDGTGLATSLKPQTVAAFNDCSARRPNADKISEKKNWGADSKGLAASPSTKSSATAPRRLCGSRVFCAETPPCRRTESTARSPTIRTTARNCSTGSSTGCACSATRRGHRWRTLELCWLPAGFQRRS